MKRLAFALVLAVVLGVAAYFVVPRISPRTAATPPPPAAAPQSMSADAQREFDRWYSAQPRFAVPVSSDGALVLVVKFTDYQCPGCGWSHGAYVPVLAKWEKRFPGAVRLVSKQYPLNTDCNKAVSRTLHPVACEAAVAALLADEQHRGKAMEDWLYANQEMMTPDGVRQAAASVAGVANLDAGRSKALQAVTADTQMARMLGVSSTPTFFINGVKMVRTDKVMQPDELDAAIAYELRKAGKIK
jgi:protein-disulfide isomerase